MTLYVVRHGRTEANAGGLLLGRADPDLDDVGRDQVVRIADAVGPVDRVVSSPLARCRQTAEAIAGGGGVRGDGVEVEVDERLIELDYGEFDLRPLSEIPAEVWAAWRADVDFRPPGGETLVELGARVFAVLDEVSGSATEGDVAVVTHVSPIKASLAWALGVGMETSWRSFVAQASITRIGVTERGPSLRVFNDESHLRP
ncbi:MAG: histidine phosphatase family protein [Actinomycetota bacterium]